MAAVCDSEFELVDYLTPSPHWGPSGYHQLRSRYKHFTRNQYCTDDGVVTAADECLVQNYKSFVTNVMQILPHRQKV